MLQTREQVISKIDKILADYLADGESITFFKKMTDALTLIEKKAVNVNSLTEEQRVRFKQFHREARLGGRKDSVEQLVKDFLKSEARK